LMRFAPRLLARDDGNGILVLTAAHPLTIQPGN
jgi:hypothetical protein